MKKIIFIITFFIFSGYYAFLALWISAGLEGFSRGFTVPLRLLLSVLMLFVIITNVKNKNKYKVKKLIFLTFTLFWGLYFFKVLQNHFIGVPLMRGWYEYIFYALNFCVLPFFTFSTMDFSKNKDLILNSLIFSGFTLALVTIFLYFDALISGVGRINMLTYDTGESTISPLSLAYSSVLTIFLCFFKLTHSNRLNPKNKLYVYMVILVSFVPFLLGASRGSVVAAFFSTIILFSYSGIKNRFKIIFTLAFTISLVVSGSIQSWSSITERSSEVLISGDKSIRLVYWEMALNQFYDEPILGSTIELLDAPGAKILNRIKNTYPHNVFVEVLMSTGIIGFSLFILILFKSLLIIHKFCKRDKEALWVFVILVQGLSQGLFSGAIYFSILIFFPLGIIYSLKNH